MTTPIPNSRVSTLALLLVGLAALPTCRAEPTVCGTFVERYRQCVPDSPRGVSGIERYCKFALEPDNRSGPFGDVGAPMEECAKLTACADFNACLEKHKCTWTMTDPTDTPEFSCSGMIIDEE